MYNQDTIAGIDVHILTAYFIDPKTICQSDETTNRKLGVVGTGLWLQNGTDPIRDSFLLPIDQSDADKTKWVKGACFPSMGKCI
jgi:charged multivesicular body protein 7